MNRPHLAERSVVAISLGRRLAGVAALIVAAVGTGQQASPLEAAVPPLGLVEVATDLGAVTAIASSADGRLFVTTLEGRIWELDPGGASPHLFLDLSDRVLVSPVQGLLGIALHPDFPTRNAFFVHYIDAQKRGVVARFALAADPTVGDPAGERRLLEIPHARGGHNGGALAFGADGYLYVASGDDGGIRDPDCNGQDPTVLLGKLLRLDVDTNADVPPYHAIPPDNPYAGFVGPGAPRPEIWALGLRNPWRISFDRATGDLYVADVGQDDREELDWQPASAAGGRNYGWKALEGTLCTGNTSGCGFPVEPCDSLAYTPPVLEIEHGSGDCSITGGHVYRGAAIPELVGRYLFGDFCSGILRATVAGPGPWAAEPLGVELAGITTFGEDADGELLLGAGDSVYRLVRAPFTGDCLPTPDRLCLLDGRFAVTAAWRTPAGDTGSGTAVPLSTDAGGFWFFTAANTELLVKMRDACAPPFERFWVFAAGLTNVEVTIQVTDHSTGAVRTYVNPLRTAFAPIQDTQAFACDGSPHP